MKHKCPRQKRLLKKKIQNHLEDVKRIDWSIGPTYAELITNLFKGQELLLQYVIEMDEK